VLVIVPAYNEAGSIARVVDDLRQHAGDCDVIVIDDGSTDGTADRVPAGTKVVRLPVNLGIGGAMQTGYRYARMHNYDVAVQVDGDGQHPAERVGDLVGHMRESGADLVIGSRFAQPGLYEQAPWRSAGIGVLRGLLKLLTGKTFTDCTSGFRAANRRVIAAFAHWYPHDYPEPEVVLLLNKADYRIAELPVKMQQRTTGRTSIPFLWGFFYIAKVATALLLDTIRHPWPDDEVNES
jgi:glycosyltransferase involved in cell wall biosynthesis